MGQLANKEKNLQRLTEPLIKQEEKFSVGIINKHSYAVLKTDIVILCDTQFSGMICKYAGIHIINPTRSQNADKYKTLFQTTDVIKSVVLIPIKDMPKFNLEMLTTFPNCLILFTQSESGSIKIISSKGHYDV